MALNEIVRSFEELFGRHPEHVIRAPGRVNLIGEHIDYNGGLVLPIAIERAVTLVAAPRSDDKFSLRSLDFDEIYEGPLLSRPIKSPSWANYILGVARELKSDGVEVPGFDVLVGSTVPIGSGLSSSAALEVAAIWLLQVALKPDYSRLDLALFCQHSENTFVGVNCGLMDMAASLCCEPLHALKLDCGRKRYENVPVSLNGFSFLVAHSGVHRGLAKSEYNLRRGQCEVALELIRDKSGHRYEDLCSVPRDVFERYKLSLQKTERDRAEHVISEQARVHSFVKALSIGDAKTLGVLLNASHLSLKDLYEVSCPELDDLTSFLTAQSGVLGSRLTGAGFGGCTVSLVETEAAPNILKALKEYYLKKFGKEQIAFVTTPSAGVSEISL